MKRLLRTPEGTELHRKLEKRTAYKYITQNMVFIMIESGLVVEVVTVVVVMIMKKIMILITTAPKTTSMVISMSCELTVDLSLPNAISDSPQTRNKEKQPHVIRMWCPE